MLKKLKVLFFTLLAFVIFVPSSFSMHIFHSHNEEHNCHHEEHSYQHLVDNIRESQQGVDSDSYMCCNHTHNSTYHSCNVDNCTSYTSMNHRQSVEYKPISLKRFDIELISILAYFASEDFDLQDEFYVPILCFKSNYLARIHNITVLII